MITRLWTPPKKPIDPRMSSYVKLDMAFGVGAGTQLMDKSRYRSHGTISGAAWADGLHGKALDFERDDVDYVEIAAAYDQLNFTSEDFSMIIRAYFESLPTSMDIFTRGEYTINGFYVQVRAAGYMVIYTNQSGQVQLSRSSDGSIAAGSWKTLGFSRSGSSIEVYINGVEDTSVAGTHENPAASARGATIGVYTNLTSSPMDGKIEFLRIFGGIALSTSEHLAWHNALA